MVKDLKKNNQLTIELKDEIFKQLVDATGDYAIFVMDINGIILTWNKGAERLKGYSASEIIGKSTKLFYTPENILNKHPEHELEVAIKEGRYEEEGWRVRKDGTRFWANVIITALTNEAGKVTGFSKITRDLTERRFAEEALKNSNFTLEEKVKQRTNDLESTIRAKDQFLTIASHELNTPLTTLKMQTQMRLKRVDRPNFSYSEEELKKCFNDDLKQINRLVRLVEDMLEISRLNTGKVQLKKLPVDFNEIISEIAHKFRLVFEAAGNDVEILLSKENITGNWDAFRLEQIIENLISNASKYGPGKPIIILTEKMGEFAIFKIIDQGMGIDSKDLQRIFGQFERAISATEVSGMGLGLYIAKEIAHAHGGIIEVESELNKGSTFILKLPLN